MKGTAFLVSVWFLFFVGSLALAAEQPVVPAAPQTEIVKIKVTATGKIYLNQKEVELYRVSTKLKRLKDKSASAVVWYYREFPSQYPTPAQITVFKKIIEFGFPIRFMQKDFE